jgi:multicomponent Na+:H+ antiporter subunit G
MMLLQLLSVVFILGGLFFFIAGTIGLLRFPDFFTRLHSLTKADNLGLGLLFTGLALQADSWTTVAKLGVTWLLVLGASSTVCFLVARTALRRGLKPWTRP